MVIINGGGDCNKRLSTVQVCLAPFRKRHHHDVIMYKSGFKTRVAIHIM